MEANKQASKVLVDDTFLINGKSVRIPTKYYQAKIGEIAESMEFDSNKLTQDSEGTKYGIMINSKYSKEMTEIVGCILYGRNFLYNKYTRQLSYWYRKYKTKQLYHTLTNEQILTIFTQYITHIQLGNFTTTMTFLEHLTVAKKM